MVCVGVHLVVVEAVVGEVAVVALKQLIVVSRLCRGVVASSASVPALSCGGIEVRLLSKQ